MRKCRVSPAPGAAWPHSEALTCTWVCTCAQVHTHLCFGPRGRGQKLPPSPPATQSRSWGTCKAALQQGRQEPVGERYLELVCSQLIDVGACSGLWLVPEAELEKHLVSPGQQHLAPLLSELQVLLQEWQSGHGSQEKTPSPGSVPHGVAEAASAQGWAGTNIQKIC